MFKKKYRKKSRNRRTPFFFTPEYCVYSVYIVDTQWQKGAYSPPHSDLVSLSLCFLWQNNMLPRDGSQLKEPARERIVLAGRGLYRLGGHDERQESFELACRSLSLTGRKKEYIGKRKRSRPTLYEYRSTLSASVCMCASRVINFQFQSPGLFPTKRSPLVVAGLV